MCFGWFIHLQSITLNKKKTMSSGKTYYTELILKFFVCLDNMESFLKFFKFFGQFGRL